MTEMQTELVVEELSDLFPYEDDGDDSKKTHIINPPKNLHIFQPGMEAQDIVDIARATGDWVTALCGYRFRPVHNPEKYDACSTCIEVAGQIWSGEG